MTNMKNLILTVFSILFMLSDGNTQDWPNLQRFQSANAALASPTIDESRVVFMGNSITEGWLQDSLTLFDNPAYINRGISGQTTPQMLIRFRQDVIELEPQVVVILAGINDIAGNTGPSTLEMITDNIFSMAELASANDIEVILCSVLPALDFPWRPGLKPAVQVVELNNSLRSYAKANGHIYADYFSPMVDEQLGLQAVLTYDGVHPNVSGYLVMEPIIKAAIERALQRK